MRPEITLHVRKMFDQGLSEHCHRPNGTFDDEDEVLVLEEPFFLPPPRMVFMPVYGLGGGEFCVSVDLKRERLISFWGQPSLLAPLWGCSGLSSHPPNWETILTKIRMFPFKLRDPRGGKN